MLKLIFIFVLPTRLNSLELYNAWKSRIRVLMDDVWIPFKPTVRDNFHDSESSTIWYTIIRPGMRYAPGNSQRIELQHWKRHRPMAGTSFSDRERREKEKESPIKKWMYSENAVCSKFRTEESVSGRGTVIFLKRHVFTIRFVRETRWPMRVEQCVALCTQQSPGVRPCMIIDVYTFGRPVCMCTNVNVRQWNKGDVFSRSRTFRFYAGADIQGVPSTPIFILPF